MPDNPADIVHRMLGLTETTSTGCLATVDAPFKVTLKKKKIMGKVDKVNKVEDKSKGHIKEEDEDRPRPYSFIPPDKKVPPATANPRAGGVKPKVSLTHIKQVSSQLQLFMMVGDWDVASIDDIKGLISTLDDLKEIAEEKLNLKYDYEEDAA